MDTTADRLPAPDSAAATPNTTFGALTLNRKIAVAAGVAALVAVIATGVIWSRTPDYKVLFSNLSDRDGGAVVAALSQQNVPYKFSEAGGVIMVPADKVHDARLRLASQGLPKGGTVGFELIEAQKFGTTQFQERLNYQRGLEGELARSIMALAAVESARVHLALPAANGFFREQQKPSASVLLQLHAGRTLERSQVAGIVHLVASSVPDMGIKQVSVIDQSGGLLSGPGDNAVPGGLDASQLQYLRTMEQSYIQRILEIVEPIVGRGNVKAQVNADVDFTLSESTAEQYRPNQSGEPAAVRSQQVTESQAGGAAGAGGVPGAMSNQPPATPASPINGAPQAMSAGNAAGSAAARDARRDSTTNFEVDKTVKVTRNASGNLKRLTAAVVVNHRRTVDAEGKATLTALDAKDVEQIQSLVREAIGFNKERGDALNVVNAPFSSEEIPKPEPIPMWKDPEITGLARSVGMQLGLVLLGLLAIFGVVRPALKRPAAQAQTNRSATTVVANDVALPAPSAVALPGGPQEDLIRIARDNPATVANVVRNWVNA
jgi:flagellar M-ring protein FliF